MSDSPADTKASDSLIKPEASVASGPVINYKGQRFAKDKPVSICAYDFAEPVYLDSQTLAHLTQRTELFAKSLAARLAVFLKLDFNLKLNEIKTIPFKTAAESWTYPSFLTIFKLEPCDGVGLVAISPRLAMGIVDRMLGGKGTVEAESARALTEIEQAMMEDVLIMLLDEWSRTWRDVETLMPEIVGYENEGNFLHTSPPKAVMLNLTMEVELGDCVDVLELTIPYTLFKPVLRKMRAAHDRFSSPAAVSSRPTVNANLCDEVCIPVSARWDICQWRLGDLLRLKPGDVLSLPNTILKQTQVCFTDKPRFKGEVSVEAGRVVVHLHHALTADN